jgi:hypothetical protein
MVGYWIPGYLTPFHLPNDPGNAAVYIHPVMDGQPVDATLLTRTEQALINTRFHVGNTTTFQCTTLKGHASQP